MSIYFIFICISFTVIISENSHGTLMNAKQPHPNLLYPYLELLHPDKES